MNHAIVIAAVGDANSEGTLSGGPYHALLYGSQQGLFRRGLALKTTARVWKLHRLLWNLSSLVRRRSYGGYQYSEDFLQKLWAQDPPARDETIINFFQLYPASVFDADPGRCWFLIDQTLQQLFSTYTAQSQIGARTKSDAIAREGVQYRRAAGVICQSRWAADSVIADYGVDPGRVHVVLASANLDESIIDQWEASRVQRDHVGVEPAALRLAFVGSDWRRKGLDRLIRALILARRLGYLVELDVIGPAPDSCPPDLRHADSVTWHGFVNKKTEFARFLEIVGSCDVGCLLSNAEAGGISLREFQRLGMPTIAPRVGGSPEYTVRGASHLISPAAPDAEIADVLCRLAGDRTLLARERAIAWAARHEASWPVAIEQIARIVLRQPEA